MNKIIFYLALPLLMLQACEGSDDSTNRISLQAQQALTDKYPQATNVVWHHKNRYAVADFDLSQHQLKAWFDETGQWYMTQTEIRFTELPELVKEAFQAGQFAQWKVDDVDKIERHQTEVIYVIEVENSTQEIDLYFSPDGILVKQIVDTDSNENDYEGFIPVTPPTTIGSYLKAHYPNARLVDIEKEGTYFEVEILDGESCRKLHFDAEGNWLQTQTEVDITDLPELVLQSLKSSPYGAYHIDEIDHYLTPTKAFYRFELESDNADIEVDITLDGTLTIVKK